MKKFLAILILSVLLLRDFLKEKKKLKASEKESHPEERDSKIEKKENVQEEPVRESFVLSLFRDLTFGKGYDFSMEQASDDDCILHVMKLGKRVNFLFDIDQLVPGKGNPTLRTYIETFNEAADIATSEVIKYTPKASKRLVGIVSYSYNLDSEEISSMKILDKEIYSDFAEDRRDGLTEFYETIKNTGHTPELIEKIESKYKPEGATDFKVQSIYLSYEISWPLAGELGIGLTLESAVNTIIYLTNNVKVEKNGIRTTYKNVLFHEQSDMARYLAVDATNKIYTDSF